VYAGVLFILMVTFAPGGLAGLVLMHQPLWRAGRLRRLAGPYGRLLVPGLAVVTGFVLVIELCSFLTIGAAQGKTLVLTGVAVNPHHGTPWFVAAVLLVGGGLWLRHAMRRFALVWTEVAEEIKALGARA
jgi:branched-chain amino acid transport system permease protein